MSPVEALTQIRALCDERRTHARVEGYELAEDAFSERVRAILDAVSVDATPAQDVARDALVARLQSINWGNSATRIDRDRFWGECADAVLALVRPVAGPVLSREEARFAADVLAASAASRVLWPDGLNDEAAALAARLEASS